MPHLINPFAPKSPTPPGMFAGRLMELQAIEQALSQTRAGVPSNILVTGERGIGKTSLLTYVNFVSRGQISVDGDTFNFLVVNTDIEPYTTQFSLISKVELALNRELGTSESGRQFLTKTWSFVKRFEAMGVKIKEEIPESNEELLADEFAYSLAQTVNRVTNVEAESTFSARYDGLLITFDEGDKATKTLGLGAFLKSLLERLQRHQCSKAMIILTGLPQLREILVRSHPSSLRLFDEFTLGRLKHEDTANVIDRCIKVGNEINKSNITIDEHAKNDIIELSEGFPHFLQQFGHSAFEANIDDIIDRDDVFEGAIGNHGALEKIGDRYYRDDFYNKIQKESYRQVLRIMAHKSDDWVTKKEIRENFKGSKTTLDNAIQALRTKHIILSKEGTTGVYRLQHKGFASWINLYTRPDKGTRNALLNFDRTEETKE